MTREIVALENQSLRVESTALRSRADRRLASLRGEAKQIDREMAAIVAGGPAKKALFACLVALKGVGPVLAWTLIANMRELGSLTRHQAAALIGLAPLNHDSGNRRGYRRRPDAGQKRPLCRHPQRGCDTTRRSSSSMTGCARGKPGKLALVACMRKLAAILNAVVRDHLAAAADML